jgi:hypothetical protein
MIDKNEQLKKSYASNEIFDLIGITTCWQEARDFLRKKDEKIYEMKLTLVPGRFVQ